MTALLQRLQAWAQAVSTPGAGPALAMPPLAEWPARLGLPGGAGLLLLAYAAWMAWAAQPQQAQETEALQDRTRQARRTLLAAPQQARAAQASPEQLLAALQRRLAARQERGAALAAVLDRAQAAGLAVQSATYRVEPARLPGLVRHEVALPVKGDYAALRGWLAQALAAQPGLSLDALSLKRSDAQADRVDARVTLSLWLREAGGPQQVGAALPTVGTSAGSGTHTITNTHANANANANTHASASASATTVATALSTGRTPTPARIDGWPADRALTLRAGEALAPVPPAALAVPAAPAAPAEGPRTAATASLPQERAALRSRSLARIDLAPPAAGAGR